MAKLISVRMPDSDFEALKTVAEFDGVAVAEEIREAVQLLIQGRRQDPAFVRRIKSVIERGQALLGNVDPSGEIARVALSEVKLGNNAATEDAVTQTQQSYAAAAAVQANRS